MAELKIGTTVGGAPVWNQGNFQMFPAGDTVLYKTFKIYTEHDKPQAVDNDFVSKATGGDYLKSVNFTEGLTLNDSAGYKVKFGKPISTDPNIIYTTSLQIQSPFGLETAAGMPFIIFDPTTEPTTPRLTVMGKVIAGQLWDTNTRVYSPVNPPKPVDVGLGNVTNAAQVKKAGDTMAGPLTAPNFTSVNVASRSDHVPQFGQVIAKNTEIDFGAY
ncbi:tail fiber protein p36 (protein Gp36) [Yersinia phage phiR1-RT]|uniref:Tail fiber protein p36 (Protein Gp36) n=1 Tax=Yersinia phage phiR1-RT TaxID=1206558 RepID=I7J412_BPPR1|nr:hinge connector of long tail fiber protein distal connector [Yersinia phage phiR1-RT]CCI88823.1 tail fiber protein p36 (protein Gp36) [Yersinia phage phiR1-RT]